MSALQQSVLTFYRGQCAA